MQNQRAQSDSDIVSDTVLRVIQDMTSDWDVDIGTSFGLETQLIGDLAFESIDVVQLVVSLEEAFKKRSIPFDKLLMENGRYVEDLSVGQVVEFLRNHI